MFKSARGGRPHIIEAHRHRDPKGVGRGAGLGKGKMSLHLHDKAISKLARMLMRDGKMHRALGIIDAAFAELRGRHQVEQPAAFAGRALRNARPVVETRRYKVSGRTLHIPVPCSARRQESLAARFVRDAVRERRERGAGLRLAAELAELEQKTGRAWQRREELHRRAEQNRSFAHYLQ